MNARRDKLLSKIRPSDSRGLEIGPLDRPSITSADGPIRYVDFATTEELRVARKNDPTVNVDRLAPVHFIWGDKTLAQAVGKERFDYVVASHVVEHVPDLIGWFRELAEVLEPGGVVSLVVPDKRYTFDRLRPETQVPEVVEAFLERRRRPSYKQVFEHYALHSRVDVGQAWAGAIDDSKLPRVHDEAYALQVCEDAKKTGKYVDSHCWVFTPPSFFALIRALCEMRVFAFEVADYHPPAPGEIDFFVTFRKLATGVTLEQQLATLPTFEAPAPVAAPSDGRRAWWARAIAEGLTDPASAARKVRIKVRARLGR
jgi:SAM-dependent methyltransferase